MCTPRIGSSSLAVLLLTLALSVAAATVASAQAGVSSDALMKELMIQPDTATLFWWLPVEGLEAMVRLDPNVKSADVEPLMAMCRPYTIVGFVVGELRNDLTMRWTPPDQVLAHLSAANGSGQAVKPVPQVPQDLEQILGVLKMLFRQLLGPMGENFSFAVFSDKLPDGARLADPGRRGKFTVSLTGISGLKDASATWRLPLDLGKVKQCGKCRETVKAAWEYCPWCGAKQD